MTDLERKREYYRLYEKTPKRRAWKQAYDRKRNKKPARAEQRRLHLRNWSLQNLYGVTQAWYELMTEKQKGLCAICGLPGKISKRRHYALYVDHDHKTGRVRALLCQRCNLGIGYMEESEWILRALAYLTDHTQGA